MFIYVNISKLYYKLIFSRLDKAQGFATCDPTKTFSQKMSISLAGLDLEMIHAPGETDDQIIVWYPQKKVLFPADNIYKAFPNL